MWTVAVLLVVLSVSVITDLRERKIYNALIFPSLGLSWFGHFFTGGWNALAVSMGGFAVGLGLLLIPYLLGGIGAGDVKLLSLVGALQGPAFVLATAVYMAIIGMAMAIAVLLFEKKFVAFFKPVFYTLYAWRFGIRLPIPQGGAAGALSLPYAVPIAGGTLLAYLLREVSQL